MFVNVLGRTLVTLAIIIFFTKLFIDNCSSNILGWGITIVIDINIFFFIILIDLTLCLKVLPLCDQSYSLPSFTFQDVLDNECFVSIIWFISLNTFNGYCLFVCLSQSNVKPTTIILLSLLSLSNETKKSVYIFCMFVCSSSIIWSYWNKILFLLNDNLQSPTILSTQTRTDKQWTCKPWCKLRL